MLHLAHDGVAQARQVTAQLVRAARVRPQVDGGHGAEACGGRGVHHRVAGVRWLLRLLAVRASGCVG
jgi:hypothetical protein